jgi:ADP-ribosyltransferase exoenzyme
MREHASEGNEGARDAESPDHLQSGLTEAPGTPGRGLSPAHIALLQRTAGNAAVARALGHRRPPTSAQPIPRALIQRQITTRPKDVEKIKSRGIGEEILVRIMNQLEYYHSATDQEAQRLTAKGMLSNIGEWLLVYSDPKTPSSGKASKAKIGIDAFRQEIETQYPQLHYVVPEVHYVADMRAKRFQWVSGESGAHAASTSAGEVAAAEMLSKGQALLLGASKGTDQLALDFVEKYQLTHAEILAIKVYSVGDYKTINPTLAGKEGWLKKSVPYVRGARDPLTGEWLGVPDPAKAKEKARFEAAAPLWVERLTPDDLSNVQAEARRHAQHALSGLNKLPPYDSRQAGGGKPTYRGEQLTQSEFAAMYPKKGHVRTEQYFLSTSKDQQKAESYAAGAKANGKVGILLECTLTGKKGRDIELISALRNEQEVLLLPGASLRIKDIKPPPPGMTYDHLIQVTEE